MKGQTLVEVLVALSSAVIIITAITVLVTSSLNNAQFSKNQNLATQYAQEGMEIMRKMRDSDPATFNSLTSDSYCLDKNQAFISAADKKATSYSGCIKIPGQLNANVDNFAREIIIQQNATDCNTSVPTPTPTPAPGSNNIKVTVLVSWTDNKCTTNAFCHQSKLVSCFSKFNVLPSL